MGFDDLIIRALAVCILALVAMCALAVGSAIYSDGKIDYCMIGTKRIESYPPSVADVYTLTGHRPWRTDTKLADNLATFNEAVEYAAAIGCEVR